MQLWDYVVQIHQTLNWPALVVFYGIVLVVIIFLVMQFMFARGRRLAVQAMERVNGLSDEVKGLQSQIDGLERRIEKRINDSAGDLESRIIKKMEQKGDRLQERFEERVDSVSDRIASLDSRVTKATEDVARFRERVDEVEDRIPNLFDRMDEFRSSLNNTFQAELSGVLSTFDNSLAALLEQMKSDLQLGISRIEGIEGMIASRERAEANLLGPSEEPAAVESGEKRGEEDYAEWEEEAKELAEQEAEEPAHEAPPAPDAEELDMDDDEDADLLAAIPAIEEEELQSAEEPELEYPFGETQDQEEEEDEEPQQG